VAHTVIVRQFDTPVTVDEGETILDAAVLQGLDYPCGCVSGNCGACKSELIAGAVDLMPYSEFALEPHERDQGLILACRAIPKTDCAVAYIDPDEVASHPRREASGRVVELARVTPDVAIVRLEVADGPPLEFSAGQYVRLGFAALPVRDFSMANRPDQAVLEFHIRRLDGGTVSRHVFESLKTGDRVSVAGPLGVSYLRRNHRGPILAVAGSTGLAPVKSVVETALGEGMKQPIHLYFGVRTRTDLYLADHFTALAARHANFRFVPVLSDDDWSGRHGLVTHAVAEDFASLDGFKAYVAGPPAMAEAAVAMLGARGLRRPDCHMDAFYTEAERAALEHGA